ncbi:MAG: isopeptide-forming domain-containing fimbrial protein [Bifidobacterium sp.]|nr:isopeptide-forming domain-containing fimbrial protein [Bifidobacterium sp.]
MQIRSAARTMVAMIASAAFALGIGGAMGATAMAADATDTTITITAPDQADISNVVTSVNDRSFKAYQLADYTDVTANAAGTAVSSYDLTPASGISESEVMGWIKAAAVDSDGQVASDLSDVIADNNGTISFTGAAENLTALQFVAKYFYGTGTDDFGNDHANNPQMRAFADAAEASLASATPAAEATGANNQVTLTPKSQGLYLIVEDAVNDDSGDMVARAMVTGTPMTVNGKTYDSVVNGDQTYTLGKLALKAEKVTVTKDVAKDTDASVTTGSQRTFEVTSNVPNYIADFPTYDQGVTYEITDVASADIDPYNAAKTGVNNLKVYSSKNPTKPLQATEYSVTVDTAANSFTVDLTHPANHSGETITIQYTGTVTGLATLTQNKASVTFTNDPYSRGSTGHTPTVTKNLYDTQVSLDKVKFNDASTKLNGATFAVTDASGNAVTFDKSADGLTYTVDPAGTTTAVAADVNGAAVTIAGLGANTNKATAYTFTETKAPTGYLLGKNPVTFTLTVTPLYDAATDTAVPDAGSAGHTSTNDLTGIDFALASQDHANFIDLSQVVASQSVNSLDSTVKTTVVNGGTMRVENTTSASDFAKTGGDIARVLAVVVALAAIGAVCLIVARARRNRANA